jgi:hypothetical protein
VRFLVDEMFPGEVAERLRAADHDAVSVRDLGLTGKSDVEVLAQAVAEDRVVVTENAADFIALLDDREGAGEQLVPVVVALKRKLPSSRGAMISALARRLTAWCAQHREPYRHVHWLG